MIVSHADWQWQVVYASSVSNEAFLVCFVRLLFFPTSGIELPYCNLLVMKQQLVYARVSKRAMRELNVVYRQRKTNLNCILYDLHGKNSAGSVSVMVTAEVFPLL